MRTGKSPEYRDAINKGRNTFWTCVYLRGMDASYSHEGFCENWLAAWTGNKPDHLRAFYSADAFYRDPAKPTGLRGDELLPYFRKLLAKNPNWIWEAVEILPTAKGFCLKWKATIPVGNQIVKETGLDIIEIEDGKITRNEVYFDSFALATAMRAQASNQ